jgi:predicted Zn-dependent peptidase
MGVSHLLEHMVFKGTERRSAKDIAISLEALGGSLDAYTAREHTSYQARVLDEHLEIAADVIGDLVFRPLLRDADLKLERKVVLEEISMVEDTPDDLVFELHSEAMWGSHPYGFSILGTRDTVAGLRARDLRDLHARAYHPPHLVVAAAGNVDHDQLLEVLGATGWGDVPRGDTPRLDDPRPAPTVTGHRHVDKDTTQTHIVFGAPTMAVGDPRRYALLLASTVLGGGMSSRLFQRVREELGLAYAVYTYQSFQRYTGMHGVYVGTAPETAAAATEAIIEELTRIATSGVTLEELEAGKGQLKGQLTLSMESVTNRMYRAASSELYDEPYRTLDEILGLIDAITDEDVRAVSREYLDPSVQTVLSLGPA